MERTRTGTSTALAHSRALMKGPSQEPRKKNALFLEAVSSLVPRLLPMTANMRAEMVMTLKCVHFHT